MKNRVYFFDTTLRDGEQSPGATMNLQEKLRLAHQLEVLGVDIMEAGFPASSPGDFEAVRTIAAQAGDIQVAGLARCVASDIDRCWEAVKAGHRGVRPARGICRPGGVCDQKHAQQRQGHFQRALS